MTDKTDPFHLWEGGPKEATNSQAPNPESAAYWRERAEKAETERAATVRKLLVARGELEALHDQRQLHGAVVHVQAETPTAAMKELERLCNEARDVANENAEKHRLARGFWFETLEQLRAAEKALADSKAEVEEWERLWNASNDVVGFLRARVAELEGALARFHVAATQNNESLRSAYLNLEDNNRYLDLRKSIWRTLEEHNPYRLQDEYRAALTPQAQPPAPNGNTPCGECGHPLRCHHPDLPQCSASPDCRCRGWSAQPPAEVPKGLTGAVEVCPVCAGGENGQHDEDCPNEGRVYPPQPPTEVRTEHQPQCTGMVSLCSCVPAQPAQGVAGERCAACGCTREQHKLELDGYSVPNRERSNYCIGFRTIDPDTLPRLSVRDLRPVLTELESAMVRLSPSLKGESIGDVTAERAYCDVDGAACVLRALGLTPPAKEG